jgi:hypothetical protein
MMSVSLFLCCSLAAWPRPHAMRLVSQHYGFLDTWLALLPIILYPDFI